MLKPTPAISKPGCDTVLDIVAILEREKPEVVLVGYSGGKDSTVLLHLVVEACLLLRPNLELVISYTDVGVENPAIRQHALFFLSQVENFVTKTIRSRVTILKPAQSYWVLLIGKGYPLPKPWFRWCQNHLKIKPFRRFMEGFDGSTLVFSGQRLSESQDRARVLKVNGISGFRIHSVKLGFPIYAPLLYWDDLDVWNFLVVNDPPWGGSYDQVIRIYKDARGDCPFLPQKGVSLSGCGSRFGCWVCTLVQHDRTLENQAQKDHRLLSLNLFRNWLIEFTDDRTNRCCFSRKGKKVKKGMLRVKAREEILKKLLRLETSIGMKLIETSDIEEIKVIWNEDLKRFGSEVE